MEQATTTHIGQPRGIRVFSAGASMRRTGLASRTFGRSAVGLRPILDPNPLMRRAQNPPENPKRTIRPGLTRPRSFRNDNSDVTGHRWWMSADAGPHVVGHHEDLLSQERSQQSHQPVSNPGSGRLSRIPVSGPGCHTRTRRAVSSVATEPRYVMHPEAGAGADAHRPRWRPRCVSRVLAWQRCWRDGGPRSSR